VNNHNLQPGCLHVGLQIDYDNTHFQDNIENIITAEETNVYLAKQNANATSAMYVGSALPDLTGSSDFITQSDLEFELLNYYTKEDIDNASYISSTDLNDYVTEEELNDMGFLSAAQLDAMGYTTKDYVDTKTSQKQDRLINGVNIKTINGYSLLGNGDLVIEGGGSAIDMSAYVTHTFLENQAYVTQSALNNASYVTESQLQQAGYVTTTYLDNAYYATQSFVDDAIADAFEDSDFMTETDVNNLLSTASYVTSSELSAMGYITNQDLEQTLSNATYVTSSELSNAGYVTESEISSMGYVTETQLQQAGYATETYVSDYVAQHTPTPDLSAYVTKTELNNAGYVTQNTLSDAGYITSIPSEYITESEISSMGYITESEIAAIGYVTQSELSGMGYITSSDIPTMPTIDESIIPNTTNTYTLGDSSHIYKSTYTSRLYLGSNITIGPESNAQTGSDITININGSQKFYLNSTRFAPNGASNNKAIDLGTSDRMWRYTYSAYFIEDGTNISDKYATTTQLATKQDTLVSGTNIKTVNNNSLLGSGNITISSSGNLIAEVTMAEYSAMQQAGTLDPNTIYVITDAPATDLSYYALKTELTESLIPNTTLAYTLGDSSYLYSAAYISNVKFTGDGRSSISLNGTTFRLAPDDIGFYLEKNGFRPGTSGNKLLGTSSAQWGYTYSTYFIEDGTDISDKYATKSEISNAGYLTSIPNTYATYAAISNMGYLTSANFIYDSSTYTLTISI
jgi:hypothetical protein